MEWDDENGSISAIPQKRVIGATDVSEGERVKVKYQTKIFDCMVLKKGEGSYHLRQLHLSDVTCPYCSLFRMAKTALILICGSDVSAATSL